MEGGRKGGREGGREGCMYLELELGQVLNDSQRTLLHRLRQGDKRLPHGPGETDGHVGEGLHATDQHEAGLVAQDFLWEKKKMDRN